MVESNTSAKELSGLQAMKNIERKIEKKKLQDAYLCFLDEREFFEAPPEFPLSYDLCDLVREKKWKCVPFIEIKISEELRETISQLNAWHYNLINLEIWLNVLRRYNEEDKWLILYNLVENIVFFCLFQPSSTRDRLGLIATNAIHYANLSIDPQYKDIMDQDKRKNPNVSLLRSDCEKQLSRLGNKFVSYTTFEQKLQAMDSEIYRIKTYNFRNLASHRIAPRFEIGHTDFIKRSRVPSSELVQQCDGSYSIIEDPTRKVVSYGIGWTSPLTLNETHRINKEECILAISAFNAYQDLLKELLNNLES